jgi:hypothetical protein
MDVERLGTNTGQVELDDEAVTLPLGVHRHHGWTRRRARTEELLGESVEVAERVGAPHQHAFHLHNQSVYLAISMSPRIDGG